MPTVYFSYAQQDLELRDKLEKHLAVMKQNGEIDTWNRREVYPGDLPEAENSEQINSAEIILLLVSADFLASPYCVGTEVTLAMERHARKDAVVIPIILRSCDWQQSQFGKLKALPEDGIPLNLASDQDASLLEVVLGIRTVVGSLSERGADNRRTRRELKFDTDAIFYDYDCIVNPQSIKNFATSGRTVPNIIWDATVQAELERIRDWWPTLQRNPGAMRPVGSTTSDFQRWITDTRKSLKDLQAKIDSELISFPERFHVLIMNLPEGQRDRQVEALTQLAGFCALRLIHLLQRGDRFLLNPGSKSYESFPLLPRVPSTLVDLEPERSALGAYVFDEPNYLKARVGEREDSYEYVLLPRDFAERMQDKLGGDAAYYKWVLPQWISNRYKTALPSAERWRIYALSDGRGQESWTAGSPRPWRQ